MTEVPGYLRPFVQPTSEVDPERNGPIDLYVPDGAGPFPAVIVIHGGPIPPELRPTPRDWPVFRGYGSLLASLGLVAAVVDHRLYVLPEPDGVVLDYPTAADDVAAAVDMVRTDSRVDQNRIVLWFFSGGGLLCADWLGAQPGWLLGVAMTYPMLAPMPGWPVGDRFRPAARVAQTSAPILLTRVGQEGEAIAATVGEFLAAAAAVDVQVEIIDVPNGHHSFDTIDDTDESRAAIIGMADRIGTLLTPR